MGDFTSVPPPGRRIRMLAKRKMHSFATATIPPHFSHGVGRTLGQSWYMGRISALSRYRPMHRRFAGRQSFASHAVQMCDAIISTLADRGGLVGHEMDGRTSDKCGEAFERELGFGAAVASSAFDVKDLIAGRTAIVDK